MSTSRIGVSGTIFLCLLHYCLATPLWNPQGIGRNIRHLPCVSRKSGDAGICMFAFSCAKANGTHLGTCIDRFYFGSCCKLPEGDIDVAPPIDDNHLENDVGTTTPRIRPAITQKPLHASTARPSSTPRPTTTTARPQTSTKPQYSSTGRPKPVSSTKPSISTRPPSVSSSKPQPSSSRPTTSNSSKPGLTTPTPTFVTWTTVEEKPSPKPIHPQVSSPQPATHKPIVIGPSSTLSPTKKPISSTTIRPSSTHKPVTSQPPTSKPTQPSVKPASSTPRPAAASTKPPSTTWIPVNVSTHAPSSSTPPITTKKPVTKKPTQPPKPSTASQTVVNVLEVSSTGKPQQSSSGKPQQSSSGKPQQTKPTKPSASSPKPISTTSKPLTTGVYQKPASTKPQSSSPKPTKPSKPTISSPKPSRPSSTTSKPAVSSTRPPISNSTEHRPSSSSSRPSSTTRPPSSPSTTTGSISTSGKPPSSSKPAGVSSITEPVIVISSSTALPAIQTTVPQPSSSTESPISSSSSPTTPLSETNEVDSFNMTNYKEVCGRRLYPEARIVGGQVSGFGKWPWQISLRQWRTSTFLHKCGAALLNENWAITAAHCVENVPPSDLLLRLGEHDLSTEDEPYGYQERRVQIVASHPQFDPRTFEYDLALLRFYEPVTFQPNIIPICVPEDDTNYVGTTAFVTGWGRLYEDGPLPSILQEVSVPVINNTLCETMYRAAGYIEHIPDIFICAGWKKGGFDSCEGDSGGPMVIQRQDRRWLLAGVISWGIGCAEPNQPGVYTRISQFRHWINQILQF